MSNAAEISIMERDMVLQALRAGKVPRSGLHHIQVGRARELRAIIADIERIRNGGSAVRFIIGDFGSGKTFFLHLARMIALNQRLVTAHADLSPDRRLQATGGQARSLYAALMGSLATDGKPEGGALPFVVERFLDGARDEAEKHKRSLPKIVRERLSVLRGLVNGDDFATAIQRYHVGYQDGNDDLKTAALRWLRGEYTSKAQAKAELGVRSIIEDANAYGYLKVMARFTQLAGHAGLLVICDEMVNIYRIVNAQARNANFEKILGVINDTTQHNLSGFGMFFGGTPEFLKDGRRGCHSYPPLRSCLPENPFARDGLVSLSGPVLWLQNLTRVELLVLLQKLRKLYACGDSARYLLPDEALGAFMEYCERRIGAAYFRTPRTTIMSFIGLLDILEDNPGASWQERLERTKIEADVAPPNDDVDDDATPSPGSPSPADDDGMATFRL